MKNLTVELEEVLNDWNDQNENTKRETFYIDEDQKTIESVPTGNSYKFEDITHFISDFTGDHAAAPGGVHVINRLEELKSEYELF